MSHDPAGFDALMWPDTASVRARLHPQDADGADAPADGTATTLACSAQPGRDRSLYGRTEDYGSTQGRAPYDVLFPTEPPVTEAGQTVAVTKLDGVTLASPIVLSTLGRSSKLGNGMDGYAVACEQVA